MELKQVKRQEKINRKRSKLVKKYERDFAAHKYDGKGKQYIDTEQGKSVIAIAAPHSVNYYDSQRKKQAADTFSGGLSHLLIQETGCHGIYVKKILDEKQKEPATQTIKKFIADNNIELLIDIREYDTDTEEVITLHMKSKGAKYDFVKDAVKYSFEYIYRDKGIDNIVKCVDTTAEDIVSAAAGNVACLKILINKRYCALSAIDEFSFFYNGLFDTVNMLAKLDWSAEVIRVYRLWQASSHKPQDKIELAFIAGNEGFTENALLNICTYGNALEKVRLHGLSEKSKKEIEMAKAGEYIFLTNRLIEILFGREWIQGREESAGLRGAPVVVYENAQEKYPIGLPKANQIDGVFFSSLLYEEKKEEATRYDYVIFNRYTDSRLHIEFDKADYGDFGRVKDADGKTAKKVMIPRYYKRLLGYLDYPLKMIRSEEYAGIINRLNEEIKSGDAEKIREQIEAFESCYEKIDGEIFYALKSQYAEKPDEKLQLVVEVQKRLRLLEEVEILRIPKEVKPKEKFYKRPFHSWNKIKIKMLKQAIGKAEYLLKAEWTSETDDKNNIARLNSNMMSLLGISENDKILIRFGKKQKILRVLSNDKLTDYQIGIPAPARKDLGMNSINDIVIVHRDMVHIFWRHSEEQTIAILGTVLAVFQVITKIWVGVLLCLIVTPLIMYFVLNEERVKVK